MSLDLWSQMGTLENYMDFSSILNFGTTWVNSKVMMGFFSGMLTQREMLYTSIIWMLLVTYVAAGYVAVHSVDAGVNSVKGFYSVYGGESSVGNNLMLYELIFVLSFLGWSLVKTILATVFASQVWDAVDARIAEAEEGHTGLEEPLSWWLAMKTMTLTTLIGIMMMVGGYCMGDVVDEIVDWFNNYQDKTDDEGTNDGVVDPAGTATTEDLIYHAVIGVYSMFVFDSMAFGSYIFGWEFLNLSEDNLECDVESADLSVYNEAFEIAASMNSRSSCLENIQKIFDIMDLNHDNLLSRCEDATFQHAAGSTPEYAKKFSSIYTRASANMICNEFEDDGSHEMDDHHHDHEHHHD